MCWRSWYSSLLVVLENDTTVERSGQNGFQKFEQPSDIYRASVCVQWCKDFTFWPKKWSGWCYDLEIGMSHVVETWRIDCGGSHRDSNGESNAGCSYPWRQHESVIQVYTPFSHGFECVYLYYICTVYQASIENTSGSGNGCYLLISTVQLYALSTLVVPDTHCFPQNKEHRYRRFIGLACHMSASPDLTWNWTAWPIQNTTNHMLHIIFIILSSSVQILWILWR